MGRAVLMGIPRALVTMPSGLLIPVGGLVLLWLVDWLAPGAASAPVRVMCFVVGCLGVAALSSYRRLLFRPTEDAIRAVSPYQSRTLASYATADSPSALMTRARGAFQRYIAVGDSRALAEARSMCERVRQAPDRVHRAQALRLLSTIRRLDGDFAALDEALALAEQALALDGSGAAGDDATLVLVLALHDRYRATRNEPDRVRAIAEAERALAAPTVDARIRPDLEAALAGVLLLQYGATRNAQVLGDALTHAEQAVQGTPRDDVNRPGWLWLLATAIGETLERGPDADELYDRQVDVMSEAVELAPPETPFAASLLKGLGMAYRDRWHRRRVPDDEAAAVHHLKNALERASAPADTAQIHSTLASIMAERHAAGGSIEDLKVAVEHWEGALEALRRGYVHAPVRHRISERIEWVRSDTALVGAYISLAGASPAEAPAALRRAMLVTEGAKSHLLAHAIARLELPAPPGVDPALIARERALLSHLSASDRDELAAIGTAKSMTAMELAVATEARQRELDELERIWTEMRRSGDAGSAYAQARRTTAPTWQILESLTHDDTAVVSMFVDDGAARLFILRAGWQAPAIVDAVVQNDGWGRLRRRLARQVHATPHFGATPMTWQEPVQDLLASAGKHLAGARRVLIAPSGPGHLIPWTVAATLAGWTGADGADATVVIVPALTVMHQLRVRERRTRSGAALVVGDPLGDLEFAVEEAEAIAALEGTEPLVAADASKGAVAARLAAADVVHLATHAKFDADSPMDSGILLADGVLTAREALQHDLDADLVVLSACETAVTEPLAGQELAGLAQAFLFAGARALLVSLWKVDDAASATLMREFHAARRIAPDTATALQAAVERVRATPEWAHPHYWGPFTLVGDWRSPARDRREP